MIVSRSEKEIDTIIHDQLIKNLNLDTDSVNVVTEEFLNKFLNILSAKKDIIDLLFSGNFSLTEQNIKEKLSWSNRNNIDKDIYTKVVNGIISKRLGYTIDKLIAQNKNDPQFVSVCLDRHIFIDKIISENIEASFIEDCIEEEPYR